MLCVFNRDEQLEQVQRELLASAADSLPIWIVNGGIMLQYKLVYTEMH
jgi:hypothetical protein